MATSTNLGFQRLTFDFKSPLKGSDFNKLLYGITKPGVYKGLKFTKVSDTSISISSGIALLHTSFQGATSRTTLVNFQTNINPYDVTRTNPSQNEVVYLKFDYLEVTDNWVEVLHTNYGNISSLSANVVILGEIVYNESNVITSFNYDNRTYGLLNSDTTSIVLNDSNVIASVNDPTKQVKISASNSASGTTRTISFTDYNYQVNTLNDWITNRKYYANEIVVYNKVIYRCLTTHTSNVFNSDLSNWESLETYESTSVLTYNSWTSNQDLEISVTHNLNRSVFVQVLNDSNLEEYVTSNLKVDSNTIKVIFNYSVRPIMFPLGLSSPNIIIRIICT